MAAREDLVAALSMGAAPQQQGTADPRWQRLMQELLAEEQRKQAAFDPAQFGAGGQEQDLAQGVTDPNAKFQGGGASGSWAPEAEPPSTLGEWWKQSTFFRPAVELAERASAAPMEVYRGELDPTSDEAIERMADLAGMVETGGLATAGLKPAGALAAGGGKLARYTFAGVPEEVLDTSTRNPGLIRRLEQQRQRHNYPSSPIGGLDLEDHPAMISPSKTSTGLTQAETKPRLSDHDLEHIPTTLDNMRRDRGVFDANMDLLRNPDDYPFLRPNMTNGPPDDVARYATDQVTENLLYFMDRAGPEDWEGLNWYLGAHDIENEWAARHGLNDASVSGAVAALSPQADWNINVHLADQLIQRFVNRENLEWDPNMERVAQRMTANEAEDRIRRILFKGKEGVPTMGPAIDKIRNTPLGALSDPKDMAMWMRIHEEAWGDPTQPLVKGTPHLPSDDKNFIPPGDVTGERGHGFRQVRPNGTFGDYTRNKPYAGEDIGDIADSTWNTNYNIANAVESLLANGDRLRIGNAMGNRHKVPSFYNNKLMPFSLRGDVTMDSHALEGGVMAPSDVAKEHGLAGGTSKSSTQAGSYGTYPLFADGYRQAARHVSDAKGRLILPNQVQSVVWEMKRKLFENLGPDDTTAIQREWRKYHDRGQTMRQAQDEVWKIAERANARAAIAPRKERPRLPKSSGPGIFDAWDAAERAKARKK